MLTLNLTPGDLPLNYCFESWQGTLNDFASHLTVNLDNASASFVLAQDTVPTAAQRGNLWFDTRVDRMYRWNTSIGAWLARHPWAANAPVHVWWEGELVDLNTFDGGEAGTVAAAAGPMWAESTEYRGRFPLHVGTLPSGVAVALGGTGGNDVTTLTQANLPNVQLAVNTAIIGRVGTGSPESVVGNTYGSTAVTGSGRVVDSTSSDFSDRYYTKGQTEALGSGTAVNTVAPYRAGRWIHRTGRIFFKAS